jgi:cysteine desulfurase
VGFGAACSALAPEPSPALLAMGLSPADARRVVRFSLAPGVDEGSIDDAAGRVEAVAARLRV